jgi:hypothetical protein
MFVLFPYEIGFLQLNDPEQLLGTMCIASARSLFMRALRPHSAAIPISGK